MAHTFILCLCIIYVNKNILLLVAQYYITSSVIEASPLESTNEAFFSLLQTFLGSRYAGNHYVSPCSHLVLLI